MNELVITYHKDLNECAVHIKIAPHYWKDFCDLLKAAGERTGFRVTINEEKEYFSTCDLDDWINLLQNVCDVQGIKPTPGMSLKGPLEQLVSEYAKLK